MRLRGRRGKTALLQSFYRYDNEDLSQRDVGFTGAKVANEPMDPRKGGRTKLACFACIQ